MIANSHLTSSKSSHLTEHYQWMIPLSQWPLLWLEGLEQFGFQNFRVDETLEWHVATCRSLAPVLLSRMFLDYLKKGNKWCTATVTWETTLADHYLFITTLNRIDTCPICSTSTPATPFNNKYVASSYYVFVNLIIIFQRVLWHVSMSGNLLSIDTKTY